MMRHSTYLYSFFMLLLLSLLAVVAFVYYIDPYQIFHRHDLGLVNNQRYQNAGLINTHLTDPAEGYDAIMIGSSLSDNFTSADAQQYLGWQKTLRLFIDGGNPAEQALIANHALSKPQTRHVLWEIRPRLYQDSDTYYSIDPLIFPAKLYNNNHLDNLSYFFNIDIIRFTYQTWRQSSYAFEKTTESLGYWGNDPGIVERRNDFNSSNNLARLENLMRTTPDISLRKETHTYPSITENLLPAVKKICNDDIEVILYIPPTTKIDYKLSGSLGSSGIQMRRFILENIKHCRNISLHTFDLDSFSNDLNNYRDAEHYMPDINRKILELIGKKSNILTTENIDEHEKNFLKSVNEYKVYSSYTDK